MSRVVERVKLFVEKFKRTGTVLVGKDSRSLILEETDRRLWRAVEEVATPKVTPESLRSLNQALDGYFAARRRQ